MNRNLLTPLIVFISLVVFAFYYYQYTIKENVPGEGRYRLANSYLEDGKYDEALAVFDEVILKHPEYKEAFLARAITLMQMGRFDDARADFDKAIRLDGNFAVAFANRGILNDRTGRYEEAVRDYRKAAELNPDILEGPGLIWRFLHNVSKKPTTLVDRADYIEKELKKPESERLLRVPELDAEQRMYKK